MPRITKVDSPPVSVITPQFLPINHLLSEPHSTCRYTAPSRALARLHCTKKKHPLPPPRPTTHHTPAGPAAPQPAQGSLHSPDDDDDEGLHCWPPITSLVDLVDIGVKLSIQLFSGGHLGPCPPPKASAPSPAAATPGVAAHPTAAAATCKEETLVNVSLGCLPTLPDTI